jgi:hypothetical protein
VVEAKRLYDTVAVKTDLPFEIVSFSKVKAGHDLELDLEMSARSCFDIGGFQACCVINLVINVFRALFIVDKNSHFKAVEDCHDVVRFSALNLDASLGTYVFYEWNKLEASGG